MAMTRKSDTGNKFDKVIDELNEQEQTAKTKSKKVHAAMVSGTGTKTIVDKNGRERTVKIAEKRKTMPVYIPENLYEKFNAINRAYGKSNNAAIVELIRDYVTEKKGVLDEI